jgi:hypothetical protein
MMAMEISEYAGLITLLGSEILSVGQLYRDHADCEESMGWGGFTPLSRKNSYHLSLTLSMQRSTHSSQINESGLYAFLQ